MIRLFALALVALAFATPSFAQTSKVFVASTGNDGNDGSRATPKRSFQAAHDAVAAGGEIVVLDTAGYGALIITKSVGVVVPPGVNGFVTVGVNSIGVQVVAGASDIVTLRGLIIEGANAGSGTGIALSSVGTLIVEDTVVRNFYEGINTVGGSGRVVVHGGAVRNTMYAMNIGAIGSKIVAHISDLELSANANAIEAYGRAGAPTYVFVTRAMISTTSGAVFSANGVATIITDSCSVVDSGTVFMTDNAATTYARNNSVVSYTTYGTPGVFSGQIQ